MGRIGADTAISLNNPVDPLYPPHPRSVFDASAFVFLRVPSWIIFL
jgi:hypothetical protein